MCWLGGAGLLEQRVHAVQLSRDLVLHAGTSDHNQIVHSHGATKPQDLLRETLGSQIRQALV